LIHFYKRVNNDLNSNNNSEVEIKIGPIKTPTA